MREIIRASSLPALSPLQTNLEEKQDHYTSPKPFPQTRYPQTPPHNYMSPRSSVLGGKPPPLSASSSQRQFKERDSHIYYLNTPPRTMPSLPQEAEPVYEPLPGIEGNYQIPRRFFPPDVPPRPLTRKRTVSRDTLATIGLSTSRDCIDETEEKRAEQQLGDGVTTADQEGCDYVEMNSVDFSSATI